MCIIVIDTYQVPGTRSKTVSAYIRPVLINLPTTGSTRYVSWPLYQQTTKCPHYHCIMDYCCVMVERVGPVLASSGFSLASPGHGWMERRWVQGFDARAIILTSQYKVCCTYRIYGAWHLVPGSHDLMMKVTTRRLAAKDRERH